MIFGCENVKNKLLFSSFLSHLQMLCGAELAVVHRERRPVRVAAHVHLRQTEQTSEYAGEVVVGVGGSKHVEWLSACEWSMKT